MGPGLALVARQVRRHGPEQWVERLKNHVAGDGRHGTVSIGCSAQSEELRTSVRVTINHDDRWVHTVTVDVDAAPVWKALGKPVDGYAMAVSQVRSLQAPRSEGLTTYRLETAAPSTTTKAPSRSRDGVARSSRRARVAVGAVTLSLLLGGAAWAVARNEPAATQASAAPMASPTPTAKASGQPRPNPSPPRNRARCLRRRTPRWCSHRTSPSGSTVLPFRRRPAPQSSRSHDRPGEQGCRAQSWWRGIPTIWIRRTRAASVEAARGDSRRHPPLQAARQRPHRCGTRPRRAEPTATQHHGRRT